MVGIMVASYCQERTSKRKLLRAMFLGGLRDELKETLKLLEPETIDRAIRLAKNKDEFLPSLHKYVKHSGKTTGDSIKANLPKPAWLDNKGNKSSQDQSTRTINWALIKEKKQKGLCFKCDKKYTRGHVCTNHSQMFVIEGLDDELEEKLRNEEVSDEEVVAEEGELSVQTLNGTTNNSTLKILGQLKKRKISILIDSGSTHSFIDEGTARQLGCDLKETNPLTVTIADGGILHSRHSIPNLTWKMQDYEFSLTIRTLKLGGCDMVLGVDWMKKFGPVSLDYNKRCMKEKVNGLKIRLYGTTEKGSFRLMSGETMGKSIRKGLGCFIGQLYHMEYQSVFEEPSQLPPIRATNHAINLKVGAVPPNQRPYCYPFIQKGEIEALVAEMKKSGFIRSSTSSFASPVILVKKKDGTWRFCVDYRQLNEITIKDKYSIPVVDELLDELNGATVFTKLDLRAGYHQIRVREEDIHKTAFRTHSGLYEFRVMPFGLSNAPATFQALMNDIFREKLRKNVLVFFDDILIYSTNIELYLEHLEEVLKILTANSLLVKQSKCSFGQKKLDYLGHLISGNRVEVDPQKISCIQDWPVPKNIKALRGFLGLAGYYRRFVCNFGVIGKPLHGLLKKGMFKWSDEADKSFKALKQALMTTPVLALPNFSEDLEVETDASYYGIGAVLMQKGRPIAYLSKAISKTHLGFSTYEKELLVVLMAVTKWRHYLYGRYFIIRTDHQSLKFLMEQKITTVLQQRWLSKLLGFNYSIIYKRGKTNMAADALSRRESAELTMISTVTSELLKVIGVNSLLSTVYHPETDGQTERVNQCLEAYLRCMSGYKPKFWSRWLALAEWWYNTSFHSSLKVTPYQALYGVAPIPLPMGNMVKTSVGAVEDFLKERVQMSQVMKDNLVVEQNRMKQYADRKRQDRTFAVGDWVFLKLAKLGELQGVQTALPSTGEAGEIQLQPEAVLERRLIKRRNHLVAQALIQWTHTAIEDSTWEDWTFFRSQFP
ncbi:uncharacterized protein LOC124934951 [Impatiens glandulifera]|uniref:uncharacterized protein LOC124934951 n=1 Tax=Impatiens glandulifera TaxID=253017 RepID=UPI001FB14506|nr:uncharacterized protein LOC124934951 [Impatiens glandulifera]